MVRHVHIPQVTATVPMVIKVCIVPRDAPKEGLAITAAARANATKIMLFVVLLTAIVSVYLVTMATYVQNSAPRGRMATSVNQTVLAMKMEHAYVIIGQVNASVKEAGKG